MPGAGAYQLAKPVTLKVRLESPNEDDRPQHLSDFLDRLEKELKAQDFTDIELQTRDRASTFSVSVKVDNTEDLAVFAGWSTFPDLLASPTDTRAARLTYTHTTFATIPLSAHDHPVLEEAAKNAAKTLAQCATAAARPGEVAVV